MWILLFCWGETSLIANPTSFIWISSSLLFIASSEDCAAPVMPCPVAYRLCLRHNRAKPMDRGCPQNCGPEGRRQFKSQEYQESFWVWHLQKINNLFKFGDK